MRHPCPSESVHRSRNIRTWCTRTETTAVHTTDRFCPPVQFAGDPRGKIHDFAIVKADAEYRGSVHLEFAGVT